MAIRILIKTDGAPIVHFANVGQKDVTLCGHDIIGDSTLGYEQVKTTTKKANCIHCCQIVDYAKDIYASEYERNHTKRKHP